MVKKQFRGCTVSSERERERERKRDRDRERERKREREREREREGREREKEKERERERGERERKREREREREKSYTLVIFFGCSAGLFYHGHHHSCRGFQHGIIWTANAREQSIIPCQRRNEPEHTSQNKTLPANHSIDFLIGMS